MFEKAGDSVSKFAKSVGDNSKKAATKLKLNRNIHDLEKVKETAYTEMGIDNADIDQLVNNLHHTKGEVFGGYVKLNRKLTRDIYKACED